MTDLKDDKAYAGWLLEQLDDAEAYTDSDIVSTERQQALDFYLRRPMGDERPGRSQVISGDVYKVVEGVSTAIADIYCSTADAIQFKPRGPDDQDKAEQQTEAVNYTFWTTCGGYLPMLEAIKSGVQFKTGYLMWYWAKERRLTREKYKAQTQESLAMLVGDGAQIKSYSVDATYQGEQGLLMDVTIDIVREAGRPVVESVAPEHVKVSPLTKTADLQRSPAVFVDSFKSEQEALKCGYEREQLEKIQFDESPWNDEMDRNNDRATSSSGQARFTTAFVEVDRDGDGIVELHKTVFCNDVILSDEIVDEINIASWTPNIQPHEYFGRCPADDAIQSQKLNSTLWRQGLDSLYHSTNPQWRVDPDDSRVSIEDFYQPEIGKPVRAAAGMAEPVVLPYVGQHVFPMLEFSTSDTENLTGFTRYSQGLDAQSLNKTLGGMRMITNMSQQRVKMMARNFGELCLSRCLKGLSKLLAQNSGKALSLRLRGNYVDVDPREWSEEYDLVVNVGLGSVDPEQQQMQLGMVAQAQAAAVQAGGMGKLISPKNIYNVQNRITALAGIKDPTFAWLDPDSVPPQPPQQPPPDPRVQMEGAKLQADQQKFQAQTGIDMQKLQAEQAFKASEAEKDRQLQLALAMMNKKVEEPEQEQVEVDPAQEDVTVGQMAQMLQESVMFISDKVEGSKPVSVEKIRDEAGRMIGAVITQADGSVREVSIQ